MIMKRPTPTLRCASAKPNTFNSIEGRSTPLKLQEFFIQKFAPFFGADRLPFPAGSCYNGSMITKGILAAGLMALAIFVSVRLAFFAGLAILFYFVSLEIDKAIKRIKRRIQKQFRIMLGMETQKASTSRKRKGIKRTVKTICADCAGGSHIWCKGKCDCDNRYHAEEAIRHEQAEKARIEKRNAENNGKIPF